MNLIHWSLRARLAHLPGYKADTNSTGITVHTPRKTWESWPLAAHPNKLPDIVLSQGHNEMVSIRHYLNIAFTPEERAAIMAEVEGWVYKKDYFSGSVEFLNENKKQEC
jgi:hypothetical protein